MLCGPISNRHDDDVKGIENHCKHCMTFSTLLIPDLLKNAELPDSKTLSVSLKLYVKTVYYKMYHSTTCLVPVLSSIYFLSFGEIRGWTLGVLWIRENHAIDHSRPAAPLMAGCISKRQKLSFNRYRYYIRQIFQANLTIIGISLTRLIGSVVTISEAI